MTTYQVQLSGRTLQEAVAQHVMGWTYTQDHDDPASIGWKPPGCGYESPASVIPSFESDIKFAWWVVERMRELGWRLSCLQSSYPMKPDDFWAAEFTDHNLGGAKNWRMETVRGMSELRPKGCAAEAICRAALAAVEIGA